MKTAGIGDLKNNLCKYLVAVRNGEEILIKDRETPIAKIVPIHMTDDEEAQLAALAHEGKVSLPRKKGGFPEDLLAARLPRTKADVQKILREDRDAR